MGKANDLEDMELRIISAMRASGFAFVSRGFLQASTGINWPRLLKVLPVMVNKGSLSTISTSAGPMYCRK